MRRLFLILFLALDATFLKAEENDEIIVSDSNFTEPRFKLPPDTGKYQKGMTFVSDSSFDFQNLSKKIKGYCPNVTFGSEKALYSLKQIKSTGVTWVAIVVTEYQQTAQSTEIYPIYEPVYMEYYTHLTATIPDLTFIINAAHRMGLRVMLKPHIDIQSTGGRWGPWRGNINGSQNKTQWFESYTAMILKYAALAEALDVELFSISCELQAVNGYADDWRKMIKDIRQVYTGNLTAAANPSEEYSKQFWDDLDFIGVDTYYYHANKGDSLDKIYGVYNPKIKALKSLGDRFNKPVLITEVGQCSSGPCDRKTPCDVTDFQTQANFYEALLKIQEENSDWLKGIYFWSWNSDPAFGGEKDPCISPQYKPAEEIMRKYFGGTEKLPKPDYAAECLCTV